MSTSAAPEAATRAGTSTWVPPRITGTIKFNILFRRFTKKSQHQYTPKILSSQSSQSVMIPHAMGYPAPEDVPSEQQLNAIIDDRIKKFNADRNASIREKARTFVDIEDKATAIRFSRKRTPYWYVTINPKPGVGIETLHNSIVDVLSHNQISDPIWSYEIRKAPDEGLHAHLLFTCHELDDNFCKRKIKAPFIPNICQTLKHIHIKWVTQAELEAVKSYIRKTTTTKSKKASNTATIQWRQANQIPAELNEDHLLVWSEMPELNNLIPLN